MGVGGLGNVAAGEGEGVRGAVVGGIDVTVAVTVGRLMGGMVAGGGAVPTGAGRAVTAGGVTARYTMAAGRRLFIR